jgi:ATP-dependent DNA helicase RecG
VIDEQHRFGTAQRRMLAKKEKRLPHLLSMTATPIPRTLALTLYGDLDLTLLDQMPPGRKRIITQVVKPSERSAAYEHMRTQLRAGRQAYVICPRIDEPDPEKAFALQAKSVKAEAKRLKKDIFPEYAIDILHSKMTPKEKDTVMERFSNRAIDILVATSVVEVGVNVPNATMILIEGAERFGLSQLHQLRGRVVRSNHQAYCFVVPESRGEPTLARLKALVTAKNGFELAEQDLMQRGPGELSGRKQWGISDIGMEALKNLKLVEAARTEAQTLIQKDPELLATPLLAGLVVTRAQQAHFE